MRSQTSYPKDKINILLLEGTDPIAEQRFNQAGYKVRAMRQALEEEQLLKEISKIHLLGIRSRTRITQRVLDKARNLLAIGCYCIGTNQVEVDYAASRGVLVFNAPFSNTRSVAELTMAEMVMLARGVCDKSKQLHQGEWGKSSEGSLEIRHKTVGIVGYGHIGPQVGLLAEAFGMKVLFYDITPKLPLGNAQQLDSLERLLAESDFVTLHVPETRLTRNMIAAAEFSMMKQGSFLLNLSRGQVVDIKAACKALKAGKLAGAAFDVFPQEPSSNEEEFVSELRGLPNVILTPHIGGSTKEAQRNIGLEVSNSLIKFTDTGSSGSAVNFPEVELPLLRNSHRVLNIHKNVPGVLSNINRIISDLGVNIQAQYLSTRNDVGYLIMDVETNISSAVKSKIEALETSIKTRLLF